MPTNPPRCEPPEEARGERYHWCADPSGFPEPAGYRFDRWCLFCHPKLLTPEAMHALGYRWLAVAKPPEGQDA